MSNTNSQGTGFIPHDLNHLPAVDIEKEAIGRDQAIKDLHRLLNASPKISVVRGIGGMGKTTLAKAYVTAHGNDYDHIAWIGGADNLVNAVANDTQLHQNLGLQFGEEKPEERYCKVMLALNQVPGQNLLVLDNAEASVHDTIIDNRRLHEWLPGGGWKKIATSRGRLIGFQDYLLKELEPDEAIALFRHYSQTKEKDSEIHALVELVGYHTLTIEILAKTLVAGQGWVNLSVSILHDRIANHRFDDPELQHQIELDHPGDNGGIYVHLMSAFDVADLPDDEKAALQLFLLLPPEGLEKNAGHPPAFFMDGFPLPEQLKPNPAKAFNRLADKGWLERDVNNTYKLHRLLREVLLYRLKPSVEEAEGFIGYIANLLNFDAYTNFLLLFPKLPFGDVVEALYGGVVNDAVARLESNMGVVYRNAGNYQKASDLLEASLEKNHSFRGESDVVLATLRSNLANVYREIGRYAEAAALLEAALASDLGNFGEAHPKVATRRSNLANVYKDMGRYAEAAALLESALASDLANFGESHPYVAISRSNLANVYESIGRYAEAAALLESALASDLANFGESHPSVATSRSNLAVVYRKMGRHAEAAALLESALASDLANFGESHPDVASRYNNLAFVYRDTGQYQQALDYFLKALGILQNAFGEQHPNIDSVINSILTTIEQGAAAGDPSMLALKEER